MRPSGEYVGAKSFPGLFVRRSWNEPPAEIT